MQAHRVRNRYRRLVDLLEVNVCGDQPAKADPINPILATVCDAGPALIRHLINVSCLLGIPPPPFSSRT